MTKDTATTQTRSFELLSGITVNLHQERCGDEPSAEFTESVDAIEQALLDLSVDDSVIN